MRSIFVLILVCAHSIFASAEPIIYRFPDKVQSYIESWAGAFDESEKENLFLYLGMSYVDEKGEFPFALYLCTDRGSGELGRLADRSNRWARVGSTFFPIVIDYDETYGVSYNQDLGKLGTIGQREGLVQRSRTLFHGCTVFFDLMGKHVKCTQRLKTHSFSEVKPKEEMISPKDSASIVYVIPDRKELELAAIIEDYALVYIHRSDNEVIIDPVLETDSSSFVNNSRRCVLVDSKLVPLVFDYDLLFTDMTFRNNTK